MELHDQIASYSSPNEVLADTNLNMEAKRALLEQWKLDEDLKATATSENMEGDADNRLDEVEKALLELEQAH